MKFQLGLYLEHRAGLFVEVHSGDDTSGVLLHVKDAGAVGELHNVHLVADPARWGALKSKKIISLNVINILLIQQKSLELSKEFQGL